MGTNDARNVLLTSSDAARHRELLARAEEALHVAERALAQREDVLVTSSLPSVKMMVRDAETRWLTVTSRTDIEFVERSLAEAAHYAETLSQGKDPFATRTGPFLKAYISPVDGSLQPYAVYVPPAFDPGRSYPLVISLHGGGSNHVLNLRRVFGKGNKPDEPDDEAMKYFPPLPDVDVIVASPCARGTMGYAGLAEKDVFRVIEEVKKCYPIDDDRLYLTGHSMGAGGTWQIALEHPDMFAAIACVSGVTDSKEAAKFYVMVKRKWGLYERAWWAAIRDILPLLDNARHFPVFCYHGEDDPYVHPHHSREAVARLKELGYEVSYEEFHGVGHTDGCDHAYANGRIFPILEKFRRVREPREVVFKTTNLAHSKAFWVRIDSFLQWPAVASVRAKIDDDGFVIVDTDMVGQYTLLVEDMPLRDKASFSLVSDGQRIEVPVSGPTVTLYRTNGSRGTRASWSLEPPVFVPRLRKRGGLEGPLHEAFGSQCTLVTPSGGESVEQNARVRELALEDSRWHTVMPGLGWVWDADVHFPVKRDLEVTQQDIEDTNLVAYGNSETNLLLAEINAHIPVHFDGTRVVCGGDAFEGEDVSFVCIYPNPLNPARYVVVFGSAYALGIESIRFLPLDLPDFVVYRPNAESPEEPEILSSGYFDSYWQL
jgi:acetyl esterase/lipase